MKSYRFAALLVLSLSASIAHAGRDQILIQQTRMNQLAHDARVEKARQAQEHKEQAALAQAPQH
jgi:hypothetical protein